MTPLAQAVMRSALKLPNKTFAKMLAKCTCFDMTDVMPLIERTARELIGTTTEATSDKPMMEHGGLLFTPSEFTWLEQRPGGDRNTGVLVHAIEDQIAYTVLNPAGEVIVQGFIELQPDDEHFSVHLDMRWPHQDARTQARSANAGGWTAASLLLINAPHGVERQTTPAHRGLERDVRNIVGVPSLKPSHVIRLSMTPGEIGEPATARGGAPKAFHFCRSHVRRLAGGRTARVRAHWRGDPSLGVGNATYKVTP